MWRRFMLSSLFIVGAAFGADTDLATPAKKIHVVIIPVRDQIASPELFILRRGLKDAESEKADLVVLDMKTPGGALDTTFDIM